MIVITFKEKYGFLVEPYILAFFSFSKEEIRVVPEERLYLIEEYADKIVKFPDDFAKMKDPELRNFDYSVLPDHGIFDVMNPNIYSVERKGRIYASVGCEFKENCDKNCPLKKLKFYSRDEKYVLKDMEILDLKYYVKKFKILGNCKLAIDIFEKNKDKIEIFDCKTLF